MRLHWLSGMALAVVASVTAPASARPASEIERYYLGHYAAMTMEQRSTRCRVDVSWADDVGGEVTTSGCAAWPDLAEGLRWWVPGEGGDVVVEDALHKQRYRIAETDAGFVAILSDDTHLWLEPVKLRRRKALS